MPAGAEGFGSTASSFLFVGLPWQQEAGSRGERWLQRKGSLEGNKSRNQGAGGNAIPTHVLCVSTSRHYYLDYKSSKAFLMGAFSDFITMKTSGQSGW